ncbi:hypothetical protein AWV79_16085 [Cupriavidus sp. UYMMa02A]|nr:hypothetical protein AWV79_16085 [Cupriavidus sp. UYMMa02A]
MTSFFTTFTAGVSIDRRADHHPPAAPGQPAREPQESAPARRASFSTAAVRALTAAWRKLRR